MAPYISEENIANLIAVDECSVRLETRLRKVIAKKGSKPVITSEKSYSKGVSIIGGISGTGWLIWDIIDTRANSSHFKDYLETVKSSYGQYLSNNDPIHMQLDNATYHKTKTVKKKAKELGIKFHFQPSHSPHVMAAEEIWRQLREFLRFRLFKKLHLLREAITEFFLLHPILNIHITSYLT